MKKRNFDLRFLGVILRYAILILIAVPNLWLFYAVFTPLTVYPSYFISNLFMNVSLIGKNILLINNQIPIELIKACIAGSAYYLLLILNLSIPDIKLKTRIFALLASFGALLVLNVARIVFLMGIYANGDPWFNITHIIFWYALSTIFVVGIWFAEVKLFKIKGIPFYSDIKFLARHIRPKR